MTERVTHRPWSLRRPVVVIVLALIGSAVAIEAQAAGAAATPTIAVTPSGGLDPAGATVTVSGTGFSIAEGGIYVGVAATDKYSPTNAGAFGAVKYVHTGATPSGSQDVLNSDGAFSTTLSFPAIFGSGANATNCLIQTCAIYTMAARGSSDRSQDTSSVVHFQNPQLTVSPASDLTNGSPITVTGTGFTPGKGIYLAETIAKPAGGPPSAYTGAKWIQNVDANGAFTSSVTVSDVFTAPGASAIDCRSVQCYVASFNDHGDITNRGQDVWVPISFAAVVPTDPTTAPITAPTVASPSPVVTVAPSTGLEPAGSTVTIVGHGFKAQDPGIYVGIASTARFSATSMDAFGTTKWVHLGATASARQGVLEADGSFSITLPIWATFGTGASATDCRHEQCAIYTFAAHGSSDRSQDTSSPVAFAGAAISTSGSTPTTSASGAATAGAASVTVAPGDTQTVTGSGFAAGELVQATLHSRPIDLGTFTADPSGTVTLTFTVPADLELGGHSVALTGLTSGRSTETGFTVVLTALATDGDPLASTGSSVRALALVAVLLIGAGAALMFTGRRRIGYAPHGGHV